MEENKNVTAVQKGRFGFIEQFFRKDLHAPKGVDMRLHGALKWSVIIVSDGMMATCRPYNHAQPECIVNRYSHARSNTRVINQPQKRIISATHFRSLWTGQEQVLG